MPKVKPRAKKAKRALFGEDVLNESFYIKVVADEGLIIVLLRETGRHLPEKIRVFTEKLLTNKKNSTNTSTNRWKIQRGERKVVRENAVVATGMYELLHVHFCAASQCARRSRNCWMSRLHCWSSSENPFDSAHTRLRLLFCLSRLITSASRTHHFSSHGSDRNCFKRQKTFFLRYETEGKNFYFRGCWRRKNFVRWEKFVQQGFLRLTSTKLITGVVKVISRSTCDKKKAIGGDLHETITWEWVFGRIMTEVRRAGEGFNEWRSRILSSLKFLTFPT